MSELLPSQVYCPANFWSEAKRIYATCKELPGSYRAGKKYQDKDGNVFQVDCVDEVIYVN